MAPAMNTGIATVTSFRKWVKEPGPQADWRMGFALYGVGETFEAELFFALAGIAIPTILQPLDASARPHVPVRESLPSALDVARVHLGEHGRAADGGAAGVVGGIEQSGFRLHGKRDADARFDITQVSWQ